MQDSNEKTNRCSVSLITLIVIYFLFNICLVMLPFLVLPEPDGKPFWTMIITNIHILFLLCVTLSENVYLIASWLLVNVGHILYFCYFCVVLVANFINNMGETESGSCSLFEVPTEVSNDCRSLRTQFASVGTMVIIIFVIIPIEVWVFISVMGYRKGLLLKASIKSITRGSQTINEPFESFNTFRSKGISIENPISVPIQEKSTQNELINDDTNLIEIDSLFDLPQTDQTLPSNKSLEEMDENKVKMWKKTATRASITKKSNASSMLSNYSAKILPALKI